MSEHELHGFMLSGRAEQPKEETYYGQLRFMELVACRSGAIDVR